MTDKGLFYEEMEISTADLRVPHASYQRSLSVARVRRIAQNFDERIANKPKVSCRDGKFYVFDGQHTIAARRLRNNGEDLPVACKVYYGLTVQTEAATVRIHDEFFVGTFQEKLEHISQIITNSYKRKNTEKEKTPKQE
ncbi:MAG: hypothetical protein LUE61_05000 [Clostridiales bacterium]|nr:hypothetical protein [Clostridiales bacterium]